MSTDWNDPELNALLAELADSDEARDELIEEHRQLEKDLLRLVDPLPPHDFVQSVMKKVATAPSRPVSRSDVITAASIVFTTLGAALVALFTAGGSASPGLALAQLVIRLRTAHVAVDSALFALWNTAAVPLAIGLSLMVWLSLVMFRRAAQPTAAKVLP
jgi:hypothetical protein